jgi:hypothetical protein
VKRLRDIVGHEGGMRGDPLFRRGVELLQGTPPTPVADEVKARVWRSIKSAPARPLRGFGPLVLKLAMVGAVALAAGTAGAVIAQRWIAPRLDESGKAGPDVRSVGSARAPRAAEPASPVVVAPVDLADDAVPAPRAAKVPARASAPRKAALPAVSAASVARERTEVLDALIALRREHDAARAGTLLARYLAAHPRGALREEALALAIEAADARGDRAGGANLAQLYQTEFPGGRFLAFARSHAGH